MLWADSKFVLATLTITLMGIAAERSYTLRDHYSENLEVTVSY